MDEDENKAILRSTEAAERISGCAGVSLPFVTSQRPDRPELLFFVFFVFFLAHPVCSAEQAVEAQGERFPFLVHSQATDKIFLENSGQENSE